MTGQRALALRPTLPQPDEDLMALHTFHLPPIAPSLFDTERTWVDPSGSGLNIAAACTKLWRDEHRTKFAADGVLDDATGYTVSDIGFKTNGTITSYFFWVRDNVAGCEWAFGMAYANAASAPGVDDWLGGSGANLRVHARAVGSRTTHTTNPQAGIVTFFNNDFATASSTTSAGFDDTTALTWVAGDFQELGFNPDSLAGLALLRPSHTEYGLTWEVNGAGWANTCATYDDTRGTLIMLQDDDGWAAFDHLAIMGSEALDPASGLRPFSVAAKCPTPTRNLIACAAPSNWSVSTCVNIGLK